MSTKEQLLRTIESLPDDIGIDDAIERLYLLFKIQRGLDQAAAVQVITQEEARTRMARWLK